MNRSLKRIMSFGLTLCMVFGMNASYAENQVLDQSDYFTVNNTRIQTIAKEDLPKNVEVIRVKSEKEMKQVMESLKITSGSSEIKIPKTTQGMTTLASTSTYKDVSKYKGIGITVYNDDGTTKNAITKFNVKARVNIYSSGSFAEITGTSKESCSLTGYTLCLSLSDPINYNGVVASDGQSVRLKSSATLDYYFLLESGITKMWSEDISYSWVYSL